MNSIRLDRDGAVAVLTIDKPDRRNAFSRDMRMLLLEQLGQLAWDEGCRAIVLTGAGDHFSAGADISNVSSDAPPWTLAQTRENMREVHRLVRAVVDGPKPVIAAVEGLAYGGGMALALACDEVVASSAARFGSAFCKLGLIGDMGLMYTLKQRVGLAKAKRIILQGREISGAEAGRIGMVDEVVEPGTALAAAKALALSYVELAPLSIAYTKASYARGIDTIEDAFAAETDYIPILNRTEDFRAAIAAFKTKTKPVFKGS
jgi:2-(1,2-epoxy-1,2-dihydrophenyl)acetyl-CoA isomerase